MTDALANGKFLLAFCSVLPFLLDVCLMPCELNPEGWD